MILAKTQRSQSYNLIVNKNHKKFFLGVFAREITVFMDGNWLTTEENSHG